MKWFFKKVFLLTAIVCLAACDNGGDDLLPPTDEYIAQPRYLVAHNGKVYVTFYDGNVARIDTATLEIEAVAKVGRNPEQLAVYNGSLYVANSGGMDYSTSLGYDKTVSVVDVETFTEVKKIDVVCNPAVVVASENGVYVASYGNYYDIPSTLQFINADGDVSVVEKCCNMTEVCYNSGVLYGFFSQYDENWNATITYMSYNPVTGAVETPWIKEQELPSPYKVSSAGNYVCVTSSNYINDGDVYFYDTDGVLVKKFATGLNPVKAVAVQNVSQNGKDVFYVLNSGDWKSNNSSLTMYDFANGTVKQNYFELQNGRCLGNTANDIVVYGSKMYIAVSGESTIEVTTLDAKSIKQIEHVVRVWK